MILFLCLINFYAYNDPGEYNISLRAGYYRISIIGAQGGYGCYSGQTYYDTQGGHGAIINGILHITSNMFYRITVGESPTPNCQRTPNQGGLFGEGGNSGYDTELPAFAHNFDQGGGGGGYSSFEKIESKFTIAIAGGGSGASAYSNGASAGGIDFTFQITNGNERECNSSHCFSTGRKGGNGEFSHRVPGSGGGGGYKGGIGGSPAGTGSGGSSFFNQSYFFNEPEIIVGRNNGAVGNGSVTIEPLVICPDNCFDCNFNNNSCIQCMDGFHLYKGSCISSCNQTSIPTYLDTDDNTCKPCLSRCLKCDNGSECTQTKEDRCLRACSFFSDRRIFRIH